MMICGLPMMFLEVTTAQFSGKGPMGVWDLAPFFRGIGYTLFVINIVNSIYYNVLRAWILEYFVRSFRSELPWASCNNDWNRDGCIPATKIVNDTVAVGVAGEHTTVNYNMTSYTHSDDNNRTMMTSAEQFWQYEVLQLSPGLGHMDGMLWNFVLYVFIWRFLVTLCMLKSIKSIEKVMYVTVFLPLVLMLAIWIRALMLEGSVMGMLYYLTPTFDRITDVKVWVEAAMMAAYTLGPGWGTIPMIASHNSFRGNTVRYSVVSTVLDFFSAVFNGLICFAVLGVMAHDSGLDLEKTVTSGLSLGFTVYPTAFTYFPLGQLWSALFFINLIFVGLDSQVLSTETLMSCLEYLVPRWLRGKRRLCAVVVINIIAFILTLPFCTRGGMYIFQWLDWYAAAWTILFVCLTECVVITWVYGLPRLSRDVELMTGSPIPAILRCNASVVAPILILVLIVVSFSRYSPPTYGSYTYPPWAEALGWALALAIISPIVICFVFRFGRSRGSCGKRVEDMTTPAPEWKPNDTSKVSYGDVHIPWTFTSTLIFNITGRQRKHYDNAQNQEASKHELSPLYKTDQPIA
ncbi:sodium- and chloride-dependent glycine transporter 2-like isoform X2 [Mya arenaria]|nr:sodium- and chloride-dependent glycine transporter 2-like isoform X2 [Mya arenaria]